MYYKFYSTTLDKAKCCIPVTSNYYELVARWSGNIGEKNVGCFRAIAKYYHIMADYSGKYFHYMHQKCCTNELLRHITCSAAVNWWAKDRGICATINAVAAKVHRSYKPQNCSIVRGNHFSIMSSILNLFFVDDAKNAPSGSASGSLQ